MEEDTPSEVCGQQSSQYLEPLFYVKIAPVDGEEEGSVDATDRNGLVTNGSVCDMDTTSPERVDDKSNIRDSVNTGEIVNWGEAKIAHTLDCPMSDFGDTAFNDVEIGEPLLIQPEQNFSSNMVTDIGLQGDEPMGVKLEKVKIEPEEDEEYNSEEFGGEFSGTFPMENCYIKTEPNSDVIDSFDQWESAQRVFNGAVTDPRNAMQAGANEKTKNSKRRKRRTNLSLYKESRKRRKKTDEDGDGKHICSLCSRIFKTQDLLDQHCANHDLMTYKCAVCGWAYNAAHLVESHIRRHYYKEQEGDLPKLWVKADMTCRECLQKFNSLFSLEVHMKTHGEEIKCHNCDKSFRSLNRLLRHQEYCPNQKQNSSANTDESQISTSVPRSSCLYCPRKFNVAEKLESHIVDHRNGKFPFKCSHSGCRWEFETYDELNEHGREHGGLCPICPRTFNTAENLQKHIRDHIKGKFRFKCPHGGCGWEFKTYGELHSHRRRHGGLLICSRCHTEVWSKAVYEEHAAKCVDQLQCENCPAVFCSNDELNAHECSVEESDTNVKDEQSQKKCSICEEIFLSKTFVKSYATYIRGKYKCTGCPAKFQSIGLANYHAYTKHFGMVRVDIGSATLYKCYSCTRRFTTLGRLKQHITYHNQLKYKCTRPGCGWVFDQNEFEVHVNIYHNRPQVPKVRSEEIVCPKCLPGLQAVEGYESFRCNECPKTFTNKAQRFEHIIAEHVGGQMKKIPFTCSLCTRQFTSKSKLQEHVKNHQLLEWKCPECGWTFENKNITAEHIKETHGSGNSKPMMVHTIYKCSECGKDFPDVGSIGVHMRIHTASKLESTKSKTSLKGESPVLKSKEKQIIKLAMQKRVRVVWENPTKTSKEKPIDTSTEASTEKPVKKSGQEQAKIQKSICITCDKVFSSRELLKSHVICEHEKKSPASNTCDLKPTAEIRQVQGYSEAMEYKCPHCRRTYSNVLELKTHLNSNHKDHQPNTTGGWQLHVKNLNGHVTKYKCASCGKIFSSYEQLKSHVICQHVRKSCAEDVLDLKPMSGVYLKNTSEEKPVKKSGQEQESSASNTSDLKPTLEVRHVQGNLYRNVTKCICGKIFSSQEQLKSNLICEHAQTSSAENAQDLKPASRVHLRKTSEEEPVKKSGQEQNSPSSNISDLKTTPDTGPVQGCSNAMVCNVMSQSERISKTLLELKTHVNGHPDNQWSNTKGGSQADIAHLKPAVGVRNVQDVSEVLECKCSHCGQTYKTLGELQAHFSKYRGHDQLNITGVRQTHISNLYGYVTQCKCTLCGEVFSSHEQLKSHVICGHARKSSASKPGPKVRNVQDYSEVMECKCSHCGETYKTLADLQEHFRCLPGHFHFNKTANRQTHVSNLYGYVTQCKCALCGKVFSSHEELKAHGICEHEWKVSAASDLSDLKPRQTPRSMKELCDVIQCKCVQCGQKYKTLKELQDHLTSVPEHDKCDTPDLKPSRIAALFGSVSQCKCPVCEAIFDNHAQLKSHVICEHERSDTSDLWPSRMANLFRDLTQCKCPLCGKVFPSDEQLKSHVICGHEWKSSGADGMQGKCLMCEKVFSSFEQLKSHVICEHERKSSVEDGIGHKETPVCTLCGEIFSTRDKMKSHILSEHIPKPDEASLCSSCSERFLSQHKLKSHISAEQTPGPTTVTLCALCGKIFRSQDQLKSNTICEYPTENNKSNQINNKSRVASDMDWRHKLIVESTCFSCGVLLENPARLKAHNREYHEEQPGVKANYVVKPRSLKTEPGMEENDHTHSRSVSSSSHVPKNQLEGFAIDDEAKLSTATDNQGISPAKGTSSASVLTTDGASDDDSDATISVTEDVEEIDHPKSWPPTLSYQQDEENDLPKSTSLSSSYQQDVSGGEENHLNPRSVWSSSLVSKSQLEGFTIDEEAKANTVWVNVPTMKQGTSPARGRSSVLLSDDESDGTISITDGDILSTLGHPRLVLRRVSDEDIEMMTPSTETFHNIFA